MSAPDQPALRSGDVVLRLRSADDESARADAAGARGMDFVIELAGRVAGSVELRPAGDGRGQVSWTVHPEHRQRGIATTAVSLLIDHAFTGLGLARVEAYVEPTDLASLRVAARSGLRREGVLRRHATKDGERRDYVLLARLAQDPEPRSRDGFLSVLNAALPTKRVIAQGLIRNRQGQLLLCELTYKQEWDLPGGVVDPGESPAAALVREIREELGIDLAAGELAAVNWLPPWRGWDDACLFVFDLGVHDNRLTRRMSLQPREIRAVHWCSLDEVAERAAAHTARLVGRLAQHPGETAYLEDGT